MEHDSAPASDGLHLHSTLVEICGNQTSPGTCQERDCRDIRKRNRLVIPSQVGGVLGVKART